MFFDIKSVFNDENSCINCSVNSNFLQRFMIVLINFLSFQTFIDFNISLENRPCSKDVSIVF